MDLVDNRMSKIASTLDKLNLQLQRFQDELHLRQQDPLVVTESSYHQDEAGDFLLTGSSCAEEFDLIDIMPTPK